MTVQELIQELQKLPPNATVLVDVNMGTDVNIPLDGYAIAMIVTEENAVEMTEQSFLPELTKAETDGAEEYVIIILTD